MLFLSGRIQNECVCLFICSLFMCSFTHSRNLQSACSVPMFFYVLTSSSCREKINMVPHYTGLWGTPVSSDGRRHTWWSRQEPGDRHRRVSLRSGPKEKGASALTPRAFTKNTNPRWTKFKYTFLKSDLLLTGQQSLNLRGLPFVSNNDSLKMPWN